MHRLPPGRNGWAENRRSAKASRAEEDEPPAMPNCARTARRKEPIDPSISGVLEFFWPHVLEAPGPLPALMPTDPGGADDRQRAFAVVRRLVDVGNRRGVDLLALRA